MDCREVHQNFYAYLQNKLPPDQMGYINQHIKDCPDCILLDQEVRKFFFEEFNRPVDHSDPQ